MKKSLLFLILTCALTACGGGGGSHGGGLVPSSPGDPGTTPTPKPTQSPAPQGGTVYVGSYNGAGKVTAYDANGNSKSVSGSFSGLQSYPALKFDAANSLLYTPNLVSNGVYTVNAFTEQGQAKSLSGSWAGITNPGNDISYDPHNGFIYVPNNSGGAWTMLAYDTNGNPQSQAPTAWSGLKAPQAIAFDTHNNLFYIAFASTVQIWNESGNMVTPTGGFGNLPTGQDLKVQSVLYDPHNNTIYVSESNGEILLYDENGNLKSQSQWPGVFLPGRMAFNPDNNEIYILELSGPFKVTIYDENGNQKTQANTWNGISQPSSIAIVP